MEIKHTGKRRWRGPLAFAVMLLVFWLLARELDWGEAFRALRRADYLWVALGTLAIVATFFTRVWRWQALLWWATLHFGPALAAMLIGQAANLFLPMRGGDAVRAVWIDPEPDVAIPEALGTVVLEKVWDLIGLLLCGLLLLPLMSLPAWFTQSAVWTGLLVLGVCAALWAGLRWQETLFRWAMAVLTRFPLGWDATVLPWLRQLTQGVESLRDAGASGRAFLWTLATWGLGVASNWAVMAAFGVRSVPAALLLMAALMVGGAAIPTPGRLGVFEGICVVVLGGFDVPGDVALAIGLVLHLVVMGPPLLAAALLSYRYPIIRGADGTA